MGHHMVWQHSSRLRLYILWPIISSRNSRGYRSSKNNRSSLIDHQYHGADRTGTATVMTIPFRSTLTCFSNAFFEDLDIETRIVEPTRPSNVDEITSRISAGGGVNSNSNIWFTAPLGWPRHCRV